MNSYEQWLSNNNCCCNGASTITPDCDSGCSCEEIYLQINNLKTDINVVSGEVENKLDVSAYTPVSLSGYATEQWVEDKHYITGVDLSNYATLQDIPVVPTSNTAFTNDAGYLTEHQPLKTINGEVISGSGNIVIEASGGSVTVDDHMDSASTNPVENKVIVEALNDKLDASAYTPADLSDYYTKQEVNNLIPTVPTSNSAFTNDMHYVEQSTVIQLIQNLQDQISSIISNVSGCCAETGETLYRWITETGENDYWCSGTTKMSKEKQQSSTDGLIWTDTGVERSGSTVLEENCADCGYTGETGSELIVEYYPSSIGRDVFIFKDNTVVSANEIASDAQSIGCSMEVTEIGNNAFSNYTHLKRVEIGHFSRYAECQGCTSNLTSIGNYAFSGCTSLSYISLTNDSVPTLGTGAFDGCTSLSKIYVIQSMENAFKTANGWSAYASIIQGI